MEHVSDLVHNKYWYLYVVKVPGRNTLEVEFFDRDFEFISFITEIERNLCDI